MDLKRRLEKLEKELKGLSQQEERIIIFVRETPLNDRDEELIRKHEEELLEKLKDYGSSRCLIAIVETKGWRIQIPDRNLEVSPAGESNLH